MREKRGRVSERGNIRTWGVCGGDGDRIVTPAARRAAPEQLTSYQMEAVEQKVEHGSAVWWRLSGLVSCGREAEESTSALVNHVFPIPRLRSEAGYCFLQRRWSRPLNLAAGQ